MILVSGATGNIGSEVVRALVAGGHATRVLSRDAKKRDRFGATVEFAVGDLHEPESVAAALADVDKAFLVAGAMELPAIARHFVPAAERAGVRHVVLVSSGTIAMEPPTTIGRWHLEAEEILKASRLAWTMLRPGNFASNSTRWAPTVRSQGVVYSPAGGSSAPIDPRDIGAVAAAALAGPGHEGKTYYVTGPEVMTVAEQVEQLGKAIGKPLRLVEVPDAGARAGMQKSGMPEVLVEAVMELMRGDRQHTSPLVTETVREITGRAPRTFAQWASDHSAEFV